MNPPGILRLRLFVARNRRTVLAGLILVAVVATAGAGYVYANPGAETVTEQQHTRTMESSLNVSAVVTGETPLYDDGTELTNQRVYPLDAAENLTLLGTVDAPADASVHQRLVVEYRATRDDETVWSESRVLAVADGRADGDGGAVRRTANISRIDERLETIRAEFGSAATVDAEVRHVVEYETDRYEGQLNATVPLTFTEDAYFLDGERAAARSHATTVTVTEEQSPDTTVAGALGLLGLFAGLGAAGCLFRPPSIDGSAEDLQRQRYEEWLSAGRIPVYAADQYVEMSTLADLVNVGVDSNRRVIHDPEMDAYGIIDEETLYWYAPGNRSLLGLTTGIEGNGESTAEAGGIDGIEGWDTAEITVGEPDTDDAAGGASRSPSDDGDASMESVDADNPFGDD
jgi:hypothetical protein